MPLSERTPRLNFLRDSASALNRLSPSTAAHLMTVHHGILLDESRSLNARQQELSCGACGSIRNPETTKTIQVGSKKGKRCGMKGTVGNGAVVSKCLRCRRRTVKPVRREANRASAPTKATSTTSSVSSTPSAVAGASAGEESTATPKASDNASSKKRAKARKQGGLQALLASKKQSTSGSSLDLFDFLQS
ncbi:hypothetical protein BDV59DRAFT_166255 [Aspergillus ambiguus]|uniref:ribonuclease P Rpr2/Rpp21/SNM1 subunit n=1 Tax=Aspergillus ambiguus TaxID=176160 RepID=UPI003CCE0924